MNPGLDERLRDTSVAAEFYDDRFRHGYMEAWSQEKKDRVARLLAELSLPPRGRALDFGCGVGAFTEVLSRALPGWEIEGTDLSPVAVEVASRRLPQCRFFVLPECETRRAAFDLVFSHHVLEHVSGLGETARLLAGMLKPGGSMLHILPCGNAGSFEHRVCDLRIDGIRSDPERLFFFDEEGHLRRLDTVSIAALWAPSGFRIGGEWYADQLAGAVSGHTSFTLDQVLFFADPGKAVNAGARIKLRLLRWGLVALWAARKPVEVFRNKRTHGCHSARDYVLFVGAALLYPASWLVDRMVRFLASREWTTRRRDRAGSEMYIHFVRPQTR